MRESLLKKRYGIPASLLLFLLVSTGIICVAFVVKTMKATTEIGEPISASTTQDFNADMEPGDSNTWKFNVTNASTTNNYDICYHVTDGLDDENGVSVTTFTIDGKHYLVRLEGLDGAVKAGDEVTDTLGTETTKEVVLTIHAEENAPAPQSVKLEIEIGRE